MIVANKIDTESRGEGCPWKFIVRVSGAFGESVVVTSPELYATSDAAEKAAMRWMNDMHVVWR